MVLAGVVTGLLIVGVVTEHLWLLVVVAVVAILAGFGFWLLKSAQQREEKQRQEQFQRDMLAKRAEYEDKLYQEGDPRGVHGRYMPPKSL